MGEMSGMKTWLKMFQIKCEPEEMNAEDPLFILYTSGSTGKRREYYTQLVDIWSTPQ